MLPRLNCFLLLFSLIFLDEGTEVNFLLPNFKKVVKLSISRQPLNENGYGGRRTLPYVFTEQGISMLASVLHSEVAVNVSIGIMRTFVEMRRFISNNVLLFERISNVELKQLEYQKQTDEKLEQI